MYIRVLLVLFVAVAVAEVKARQSHLLHLDKTDGLMSGNVTALEQDKYGFLWIATDQGVNRYDGYNFNAFKMRRKGNDDHYVTALCYDSVANVVCAEDFFGKRFLIDCSTQEVAEAGGACYNGRAVPGSATLPDDIRLGLMAESVPMEAVSCVLEDNSGNVWIGTRGLGLYVRPRDRPAFIIEYTGNMAGGQACVSVADRYGGTWLVDSSHRLVRVAPSGKRRVVTIGKDRYDNMVNCIFLDSNDTLWIGTYRGLAFAGVGGNEKPVYIGSNGKIENRCVKAVCSDRNGNIWMGHSRGITRYDVRTHKVTNFDSRDGLPRCEFLGGQAFLENDGSLLFAFAGGYCRFRPDEVEAGKTAGLKLEVAEVKASDGKEDRIIGAGDDIVLEYVWNSLKISFFVSDLTCRHNVKYSYMLEGYDKGWRGDNRNNVAEYYNLPHGRYRLLVKARLRNSDFDDGAVRALSVVVCPPAWLSWPAKTVYVVAFIVLSVFLARMASRIAKRKDRERLAYVKRQQEDKFRRKKLELYTDITHELRTPLTLIMGPLEDLAGEKGLDVKTVSKIKTVYNSAGRLLGLVNRLLDFKEDGGCVREVSCHPCDIVKVVGETAAMLEELNSSPDVRVEVDIDRGIQPAVTDAEALRTILMNLVGNAFKYTPHGVVRVSLCRNAGGEIELAVADTGYGISEEALPHLFEKGFKAGGDHQAGGSGIGLSLVKDICSRLSGGVAVRSVLGEGTVFTVTLPYVPVASDDAGAVCHSADDGRKTVLVVEDNDDIRRYVAQTLCSEYNVVSARDGNDGLERVMEVMPDMIVSDVMMPGLDGIGLCKAVKGDIRTSHILVILLTAKTALADREAGYDVGADSYITKPFSGRLLLSRVRNLFNSRELAAGTLAAEMTVASVGVGEGRLRLPAGLTAMDREFMTRLTDTIIANIGNEAMDIDFLTVVLGVSRSTLYRKVKALTGMSANAVIKEIRLEKAACLIASEGMCVSEAAYRCGFNDMGNFRQAFRQKYGVTPKDYKGRKASYGLPADDNV